MTITSNRFGINGPVTILRCERTKDLSPRKQTNDAYCACDSCESATTAMAAAVEWD